MERKDQADEERKDQADSEALGFPPRISILNLNVPETPRRRTWPEPEPELKIQEQVEVQDAFEPNSDSPQAVSANTSNV